MADMKLYQQWSHTLFYHVPDGHHWLAWQGPFYYIFHLQFKIPCKLSFVANQLIIIIKQYFALSWEYSYDVLKNFVTIWDQNKICIKLELDVFTSNSILMPILFWSHIISVTSSGLHNWWPIIDYHTVSWLQIIRIYEFILKLYTIIQIQAIERCWMTTNRLLVFLIIQCCSIITWSIFY